MRAIDTAVILAAQLGKQLVVFWGRDIYLNCKFSDLFIASEYFDVIEERQWLGKKSLFPYLPGSKPATLFRKAMYSFTKLVFNIRQEIWFENFEEAVSPLLQDLTPSSIASMQEFEKKSFSHIWPLLEHLDNTGSAFICTAWRLLPVQNYAKHFVPIEALQYKINEITGRFSHTIGVHIRRTDHISAIEHSDLQKFINAMDYELKANNITNFFLATDCQEVEAAILKMYPSKILTYSKSSYNRNTAHGIQEALVDLYCLSKTHKVLGSYMSSFSQTATEISGIEEVTV